MNIFYQARLTAGEGFLTEEESIHAVRVLRLKEGDPVVLVDGRGMWAEAEISAPDSRKCKVKILRTLEEFGKRSYSLHLAVAPTKNHDRIEWLIEKATEIGLDTFTPLICQFSERRHIQINRLEKIAVAAMKQSVKAYLPEIHEMAVFTTFATAPFLGKKFIAHCSEGNKTHLKNLVPKNEQVMILIGPEGDFSDAEIALALQNGFREVTLGQSRLRTETAALAACHIVALANEPGDETRV
jgi:16S rRNA (uracil1498-N3)-methyltransferase